MYNITITVTYKKTNEVQPQRKERNKKALRNKIKECSGHLSRDTAPGMSPASPSLEGTFELSQLPEGGRTIAGAPDVYTHDVNYTDIDYEGLCPCFSAPKGSVLPGGAGRTHVEHPTI
jgi:hypothetical protein